MTRIALVGPAPRLAEEILEVLVSRGFDLEHVRVFADDEQVGESVEFGPATLRIERAAPGALAGFDAVLVCGDGALAEEVVPDLAGSTAIVIDSTPFSRRGGDAALIVPEVNSELLEMLSPGTVIALPAPATIGLAVALAPLHEAARIRRVVATVLEPASTEGDDGVAALARQALALLQGQSLDREEDPELRAFNVRPRLPSDDFGRSVTEASLAGEIAKLFGEPRVEVLAITVRVPVFFGMAQSVYVETESPLEIGEVERLFLGGRGLLVAGSVAVEPGDAEDDLRRLLNDLCPGPVDVASSDAVHVARIRVDPSDPTRIAFWLCFDDQRKGIALALVSTLEVALRRARGG